jgi:aminoglycoside phosphotransferase (APT) family kinase protein
MSFLDGRIFEDPTIPGVSPQDRAEIWHDAIRTLAKFHRVKPSDVGLTDYGRPNGFYNRQVKTFGTIQKAQAEAVNVKTKKPVGPIPHFDEMLAYFSNPKAQPKDRGTFVHGDYKIDNVVFHKTENRVIGILDWEMSTIGHPLSDIVNFTTPYLQARIQNDGSAFTPGVTPGLPSREQLFAWYAEVSGYDPTPDLKYGEAFGLMRGAIIVHGIKARHALGQASSANAAAYGEMVPVFAENVMNLIEQGKKEKEQSGAKL